MGISLITLLLVLISSIFAAFGGFTFKIASKNLSLNLKCIIKNYNFYLGFLFFAIAVIFYIAALKFGELNIVYPISSVTYIWSTLLARKYLGEDINIFKVLGILLIIQGSALVAL